MKIGSVFGSSIASGKLGDIVAARNPSGMYLRRHVIGTNPNSTRQNTIRSRLSLLAPQWETELTPAERIGWDNYAQQTPVTGRGGEINNISGFNHFIRTNQACLEGSVTVKTAAPALNLLAENDPTLAAAISVATQNISLTFNNALPWAGEAGGKLLVYMGTPVNSSRTFFGGPWRYAGAISGATPTPPTSPATLAVPFPVQLGQKVWLQARILRADGRLSDPFQCSCVVGS